MYIPPLIDGKVGVFANQLLFEEQMARDLDIKANNKVLDIGCGRGRISAHIATYTGASVSGLNIDKVQLDRAEEYAKSSEFLSKRLDYKHGNFNDPLPYASSSFDALYQVQVLTYAKDLEKLSQEFYRVF
jgi:sterol 24-C-methyltransferase